jgi:glycosyltransferase involved in cell wall biosynthesis
LPEIFEDCALYIDPYDHLDIAQGLRAVIKNPELREKLKIDGLARCSKFNCDKTAECFLEILEKFL